MTANTTNAKTFVYVLALEGGNYYVGSTTSVSQRYQQHRSGSGAEWTRTHRPIKIVTQKQVPRGSNPRLEEDRQVKELMMQQGINRVRGGSYSNCELRVEQEMALHQELRHANNACMKCGREGHFSGTCYARTDVHGSPITEEVEGEIIDCGHVTCYRCGRPGHIAPDCFARTSVDGDQLHEEEWTVNRGVQAASSSSSVIGTCFRCGRPGHYASDCYARTDVKGEQLNGRGSVAVKRRASSRRPFCERCGRDTHTADRCFASRGIDGQNLSFSDDDYY